ncbi:putative nuclease HARBI1 [Trichoplusia ni]|uniref:Nuclease HARBI1 n=1 Tax=Trichoplusia ni TaxID=7111 RepID=A0A7E5X0V3_TRINI|nr:putative nuclease HARBI1 [Trichoplusia ni]
MLRLTRSTHRRSTLYHYLAARLIVESGNVRRETREISRRALLRKNIANINVQYLSDTEFRNRFRLSKEAFLHLCRELRVKSSQRPSKRISLEHKVLCALSFYATGSYQRIVGMAKCLGQTTVSKYVRQVTDALVTPSILNYFIKFPATLEQRNIIKNKFYTKFGIPGVIGCIDGSHFHIFTPKRDIEHLFYCRKHFYSLNVQMICDSECRIINVNAKYGGATHDAFIWENSQANRYIQDINKNNEQVWFLGDSGYPQRPWMMTPIPDAAEGTPEAKYNTIHGKARVVIENTFGRLKNRWRCLCKDRTLHYTPERCATIIMACSVLHNLAIDFMVPDPEEDVIDSLELGISAVSSEEPLRDHGSRDDLIRGRTLRQILVDRINRLHIVNN